MPQLAPNAAHRSSAPVPPARTRPLTLRIADMPVRIDGLPAEARPRLRDLLRPFVVPAAAPTAAAAAIRLRAKPSADGAWVVSQDGQGLSTTIRPEELVKYIEWLAISRALEATTSCVAFHAAALAHGASVVLLLARSGVGKTTLALGLMQRGWELISDDAVLVDHQTLGIRTFPRCLHVEEATRELIGPDLPLEWAGLLDGYARPLHWATGGRPATAIFLVQRCGTCPSTRQPIMQAEAAGALLGEAVRNPLLPSQLARLSVRVAAATRGCFRLRNGHLEGALNLIENAAG